MKRFFFAIVVAAIYFGWAQLKGVDGTPAAPVSSGAAAAASDAGTALSGTFGEQDSGTEVSGTGTVVKVLPDDNDGSRHQRFILRLASGQTLLIAHNIDLASRLTSLSKGDTVAFKGVFEWNDRGGVVHWTHRDPGGQHAAGWLKHDGETFQ